MRFTVTERAFIENGLREPGEVVEVPDDVVPGPHMLPVAGDKKAEAAKAAALKERGDRLMPTDPGYFPQMIAAYSEQVIPARRG